MTVDQGREVDRQLVERLINKLHLFANRHSGHATQKEIALALASAASDVLVAMDCPCCREAVANYVTGLMKSRRRPCRRGRRRHRAALRSCFGRVSFCQSQSRFDL